MTTAETVVALADVRRSFGDQVVLAGIDIEVRRGEFVALLGRSGSGKSTLLKAIAGLDAKVEGEISAPKRSAVAFQEHRLLPWKRVLQNVTLGIGRDSTVRGRKALEEVGLGHKAEAWPLVLSGGEAQRVALARALVREPELLLLDEPFGALDALTRTHMHRLLAELCQIHQPAVLLVTHDVDEAVLLADRVLVLTNGHLTLDLAVNLPNVRHRGSHEFVAIRQRLLMELGVDDSVGHTVARQN